MKWKLTDRKRRPIAAGTVVQMYEYLKNHVPDGEYKLVGSDVTIAVRRYRGQVVYPVGLDDFIAEVASRHRDDT
jgi:hypothetical protein